MAKMPKKPKLKSYPKQPKASASVEVWRNHKAKCLQIDKDNEAKLKPYNAKVKAIQAAEKEKNKIKAGLAGLKRK